jgi:hypothetical protein
MTDDTTHQLEQPADGPASTAPVTSPVSAVGGGSRARWALGIGVAGLAVAAIVAVVVVFGSQPTPPALTYIPADAVLVVEARPDLPGDQLQKVGNLLAHFPGFADQSTLPDKLDESLAQLFSRAGTGAVDYRADIKPWLSGPAFIALMPPAGDDAESPMAFTHGVASLTTAGGVSCDAPFKDLAVTHETYLGVDLVLGPGGSAACAVDGKQALLGDPGSVRAALDAHAGSSGIDRNASYQAARSSLQGDQLATVYVSGPGYLDIFEQMAGRTPGMSELLPTLRQTFPEWVIEGLRAEDDAAIVEIAGGPQPAPVAGASPAVSFRPLPPGHVSAILPFAPANTIAYVESQGAGVALLNGIDQLRALPESAEILAMLEQEADPEQLVGWIQDAGVIVVGDQAGVGGGLVLIASDAAAATEHAATLKGLLALAQLRGLTVDSADSTVNGATVTTYTIGNLDALVPPGSVGPGMQLPSDGTVTFSIATKDKAVLIGAGEGFVTAALSVQAGSGLADQAGYKAAMSRAVPNSQTTVYVAIRDIIRLAEPLMPPDERSRWETELKPYLAPFQAFSMTVAADPASGGRGRFIVTVSNP